MKVLIIEDELELVKSITKYLHEEGYLCEVAATMEQAREKVFIHDYDCILLDIMLGTGNGLTILEELKAHRKTDGVIIITAKNSLEDRVRGLNLGADDYLSKPFFLAELSARIAAVIRRKHFNGNTTINFHEIAIDTQGKSVSVNNQPVDLTRKEFELLMFLLANKNRVVSKNAIAEHLSGDNAELLEKFDFIYTHIKNLKKKLIDAGSADYIKSIYGLGYKFTA